MAKRIIQTEAASEDVVIEKGLRPSSLDPVSYTHLDVYKRQVLRLQSYGHNLYRKLIAENHSLFLTQFF